MLHELETVTNIPDALENAASQRYQRIRGGATQVVTESMLPELKGPWRYRPSYQAPTSAELAGAMRTGGLMAGTSPTGVAKGIVMGKSGFDVRSLFMTPNAADVSRRPEQSIRNYQLAEESWAAIDERFSQYSIFNTEGKKAAWQGEKLPPFLRTIYLEPGAHAETMERLGMGEGMAVARSNLKRAFTQETIRSTHLVQANQEALAMISRGETVAKDTLLGWTDKGLPFITKDASQQQLLGSTTFQSASKGEYATITHKDIQKMGTFEKFFGDLKAVVRFAGGNELKNEQIAKGFDVIASMDDLRKNNALHNQQMITAMWDVLERRTSGPTTKGQMRFKTAPLNVASMMEQAATTGGVYQHEKFVEEMMGFGKKYFDLREPEFQRVFGAVPTVFKDTDVDFTALTKRAGFGDYKFGRAQSAVGRAQLFYGGSKESVGAGTLGSLEPRAFEMLRGTFGETGATLTSDFTQRMIYTSPESAATYEALTRTLGSMTGEIKPAADASIYDVGQKMGGAKDFRGWMEGLSKEGGFLRLGGEFSDVHVPSPSDLKHMTPFTTAGGKAVPGHLADVFTGLAMHGTAMHSQIDPLSAAAMRGHYGRAKSEFQRHQAPGGKGMGGFLRGKLIGSRLSLIHI